MTTRLLTVAQAARYLGRHPETIRRWIRTNTLAGIRRRDGYVVSMDALVTLLRHPHPTEQLAQQPRTRLDTAPTPPGYAASNGAPQYAGAAESTMPIDVTSYLSLAEAAARVQRSTRTIRRWVAQGELPNALRIKQRILVPPGDLDALFQPAHAVAG